MIGQFVEPRISPSRPMVLKFLEDGGTSDGELSEEKRRFDRIKRFIHPDYQHAFAEPLRCFECNGYEFLWSPFTCGEAATSGASDLSHNDLWKQLRMKRESGHQPRHVSKNTILQTVFGYLALPHRKCGASCRRKRSFAVEYEKYLRGVWGTDPHPGLGWWKYWELTWAPHSKEAVTAFGNTHANPLWVLARLKEQKHDFHCGAIHGDLHPKNVVLSEEIPHIIDFGWADPDEHVAKDFVLLECNMRFVLLREDVDSASVRKFTNWIAWDAPAPKLSCRYCSERLRLVQQLRRIAADHLPDTRDWDREYVIPLFLVAFGLLKHLGAADNQIAAVMTVLSLADHIKGRGLV